MAQELSRNGMLDMIRGKGIKKTIKNIFVKQMRRKVNNMDFRFSISMKIFEMLLRFYYYIRFGRDRFLSTQITK